MFLWFNDMRAVSVCLQIAVIAKCSRRGILMQFCGNGIFCFLAPTWEICTRSEAESTGSQTSLHNSPHKGVAEKISVDLVEEKLANTFLYLHRHACHHDFIAFDVSAILIHTCCGFKWYIICSHIFYHASYFVFLLLPVVVLARNILVNVLLILTISCQLPVFPLLFSSLILYCRAWRFVQTGLLSGGNRRFCIMFWEFRFISKRSSHKEDK